MHLASAVGGVALIELIILNGARTDLTDFEGRLPLHWATTYKGTKIISLLLKVSLLGEFTIIILYDTTYYQEYSWYYTML